MIALSGLMDIHIFAKIFSQQLRRFIVKIMILRTQTVFIKNKRDCTKVNSLFFVIKHSEYLFNQKKTQWKRRNVRDIVSFQKSE